MKTIGSCDSKEAGWLQMGQGPWGGRGRLHIGQVRSSINSNAGFDASSESIFCCSSPKVKPSKVIVWARCADMEVVVCWFGSISIISLPQNRRNLSVCFVQEVYQSFLFSAASDFRQFLKKLTSWVFQGWFEIIGCFIYTFSVNFSCWIKTNTNISRAKITTD